MNKYIITAYTKLGGKLVFPWFAETKQQAEREFKHKFFERIRLDSVTVISQAESDKEKIAI